MGVNRTLPQCSELPSSLSAGLRELGRAWANSPVRPCVQADVGTAWDNLLAEWSRSDLPLVIRKNGGVRGSAIVHTSGRELIVADNSPAQWAFARAHGGHTYSLSDIRRMLSNDAIPFTFATKAAEKPLMKYRCTLSARENVNKCGWKLCHMEAIGLSTSTALAQLPLSNLARHFALLMAPSNHFVVPLQWAGLGEVPEFIAEIRRYASNGAA